MYDGRKKFLAGASHAPSGHSEKKNHDAGKNFRFSPKPLQIHGFLLIRNPKVPVPGAALPVCVPYMRRMTMRRVSPRFVQETQMHVELLAAWGVVARVLTCGVLYI